MQWLFYRLYSTIKKGLGLAFGAHFLHDFSIKMFLMSYSISGKVSMSHLISFSRYQTKCVILVDDVINFKIFLGSTSKAMDDKEKKRGRQK